MSALQGLHMLLTYIRFQRHSEQQYFRYLSQHPRQIYGFYFNCYWVELIGGWSKINAVYKLRNHSDAPTSTEVMRIKVAFADMVFSFFLSLSLSLSLNFHILSHTQSSLPKLRFFRCNIPTGILLQLPASLKQLHCPNLTQTSLHWGVFQTSVTPEAKHGLIQL